MHRDNKKDYKLDNINKMWYNKYKKYKRYNKYIKYTKGGYIMTEAAKEARRQYARKWAKKNPEKIKAAKTRYWEKKARAANEQCKTGATNISTANPPNN